MKANRFPPGDGKLVPGEAKKIKIGVLALQGSFVEHINMLRMLDADTVQVRSPDHLNGLDGLIIPGGESTTIAKLAAAANLMGPLSDFASRKAVWGTCAGMIFMAKHVGTAQRTLGLMDIDVERNAFGRQADSFIIDLWVPVIYNGERKPYSAIFIRAPKLLSARGKASILASLPDGTAVAAREDK